MAYVSEQAADKSVVPINRRKIFQFHPEPPARDLLGKPLAVPDMPKVNPAKRSVWLQTLGMIFRIAPLTSGTSVDMRHRASQVIEQLLVSVEPPKISKTSSEGFFTRRKFTAKNIKCYHPYAFTSAFDLMMRMPKACMREQRVMEALLSTILRAYVASMSSINKSSFQFHAEAKEFFRSGFKTERMLKRTTAADERFDAVQSIYQNYYHGRQYYMFGIIMRERMPEDNRLFMHASRSALFMARVDHTGEFLDRPQSRRLPTRSMIRYLAQRDPVLMRLVRQDSRYGRDITAFIKAFPE